jgi:hypothetical protein
MPGQVSSQGDTGARSESSPQQTVVKYLVSNPCKIPAMGTFAQNPRVLKVAWKAIQKVLMVTNIPAQTGMSHLWFMVDYLQWTTCYCGLHVGLKGSHQ